MYVYIYNGYHGTSWNKMEYHGMWNSIFTNHHFGPVGMILPYQHPPQMCAACEKYPIYDQKSLEKSSNIPIKSLKKPCTHQRKPYNHQK